ncbi:MAG: response regulator [Hespellia sp.]|nr:response regulator [Hespellia sp.]
MNNQFVWNDEFNIGVDTIDREHKRLFRIINKMFLFEDEEEEEKSQWACQEGIKYFKEHTVKHFSDEEEYMASIHYEGLETHRRIHTDFRKKTLPALEQELEQSEYSAESIKHFLGVCAGWLIGHTLTEDQTINGKSRSKWRDLLPEKENEAMKEMIVHLLYDMFQLESQVISESYGGEKFGKGVYYRLVYSTKQDERWEIILVFEEKLLINTVGKILGLQTDKLDSTLINAARYTARQFVEHTKEYLSNADLDEMKEENLLNYEQFQKIFEGENPQISLLFDTGEGYFVYCVIAPHLLQNGIGVSIRADNAMAEIEKYLQERVVSQKKKILIVDDSAVIRQGMKELFEEDYDISTAQSGLSAIRTITLDRPDLVLLDYEMPICDGRQVLEMIRSEKEFADIPVIFLTGRVDKESIQKVVALKPEGYLPKYLKPADIKKNVDKYFEKKSGQENEEEK